MVKSDTSSARQAWTLITGLVLLYLVVVLVSPPVVDAQHQQQGAASRSTQVRFDPLRINCGGVYHVDSNTGFVWENDAQYVNETGKPSRDCGPLVNISNTTSTMKQVYCSRRFFNMSFDLPPFEYRIPVLSTSNSYIVRLHFAEMKHRGPNLRLIDIWIENILYVNDLDVFANVGFRSAYVYEIPSPVVVQDGSLTIRLNATKDNPIISGIEVLMWSPDSATNPLAFAPKAPTKSPTKTPSITNLLPPFFNLTKSPTIASIPTSPLTSTTKVPLTNKTPTTATTKPSTERPTKTPTKRPTKAPTKRPTKTPTKLPTKTPTKRPTKTPTKRPTKTPTKRPTKAPTKRPTETPTKRPTKSPTKRPTKSPTKRPTKSPTKRPSKSPTKRPTKTPTFAPFAPQQPFVYYSTNSTAILGTPDVNVAIGNPLKGLAGGPRWSGAKVLPNATPSAIEFYNIGLNEIMVGDNLFNWTIHNQLVAGSAQRKMHAVLSVYVHWPGRPLRLPLHLTNIRLYKTTLNGMSPNYGEPRLMEAYRQFIYAWAAQIDGDTRIAAVHVGLLGFWGEGHTYPDNHLTPDSSMRFVAQWFRDAFKKTKVLTRYPGENVDGFGLHDASLAYNTLDGASNGGVNVGWFQYPRMVRAGQTNIWKKNMMGGETRPELQEIIFTNTYPARTEHHQDIKECVDALHLTYVLHHGAFVDNGYSGDKLRNANKIHSYLGYAFYVSEIAALTSSRTNAQSVDLSVKVTQIGVAPFYYDLRLVLQCQNGVIRKSLSGVNDIIDKGASGAFLFKGIPATTACLENVTISLESSYAYVGRPILFAQGSKGRVNLRIPVPGATV